MYLAGSRRILPDMVARALSVRVIFLSLVSGVGAGVIVQLVWPGVPLMWVVWGFAAATYALAVWGGGEGQGQMIRCDSCGKMVKMGSDTCHHCGYSRAGVRD